MDEKKSFVMYDSWATLLFNLPTEQAGQLIKAICGFQLDKAYEIKDPTVIAMYAMVKPQMIKDAASYEEVRKQRSEYGKMGAQKRWNNADAIKSDSKDIAKDGHPITKDSLAIKSDSKDMAKMAVYDSVYDSVYVSPNGDKEKNTKKENLLDETEPPAQGIVIDDIPWTTFWSMYPKHKGERFAHEAFNNATIGTDPKVIIAGLKKVIDLQWSKWPKEKLQFIPNPATWLKGQCWNDDVSEYVPETKQQNNSRTVINPPEQHKVMDDDEFYKMMGWEVDNGNQ